MTVTVAAALVTILLASLAGCGLRADETPQPIPRDRLDDRLFAESSSDAAGARGRIYVITSAGAEPRLTPVSVRVPTDQDWERAVLDTLLRWTPGDRAGEEQLSTRIPSAARVLDTRLDSDVLTVDLTNFTIEGPGLSQAFAQILFTVTEKPGINFVRFAIDSRPVSIPLGGESSPAGEKLNRRDFAALAPVTPPPSTTTTSSAAASPPAPASGTAPPGR